MPSAPEPCAEYQILAVGRGRHVVGAGPFRHLEDLYLGGRRGAGRERRRQGEGTRDRREHGGTPDLVRSTALSWRGGCLGASGTR